MKKYKWLAVGIAVLILAAVILVSVSAKSRGGGIVCAEDGSCCVDPDACTCE
jgi:hypothetical protein